MKKELIRKVFSEKRASLGTKEFNALSKQLVTAAINFIEAFNPKVVHCFLPIDAKLEFNTYPIIEFCWKNNIDVLVPISDFQSGTMQSAKFLPDTAISIKKYNIPEPTQPILINEKEIDLVLTPLLAFDLNGYRVGYGKGFYDRFFKLLNPDAQKVGLSLFEPIEIISDKSPFDVQLTNCITPEKTYSF